VKSNLTSGCNAERRAEMVLVMQVLKELCVCVCVVASPFGEFGMECSYCIAKEMTEFVHGSLCRPVVDPDRVQVTKVACRRSISAVEGKGWSK
jgi:hypothetical protein